MSSRGITGFYRNQARLMWEWRAGRLAVIRRSLLSFVIACVALAITSALLAGFTIRNVGELLVAGLLFATLNSLSRLFFLWLLAAFPIFVVQAASVAFQTLVLIVLSQVVPGVQIASIGVAFAAALILTVTNALLSELTRAADDDSYYGTLVRQLVARNRHVAPSDEPGLLIIQIDGLSLPVLQNQLRAGRMPVVSRMLRSGTHAVTPWTVLLPSVTPASQAGILHGRNDEIPGFRWHEKEARQMFVADHPADAEEITRRLSDGSGLLSNGGSSIGNLVTGDAEHAYFTMATIVRDTRRLHGFFVNTVNYVRLVVLMVGEFGKELYQAERQRGKGVQPRMRRGLAYAAERALVNVVLRTISTALVIQRVYKGDPIVYVDYTGYDAIAHHCGPERQEATDALEGIDRSIGSLQKAINDTPRPYRIVILSDHGQTLGFTFRQLYGATLEEVIAGMAMSGTRGSAGDAGAGGLVVCCSGNLAMVYVDDRPGRASMETIEDMHPGLLAGLARHPGVGFVLVRSDNRGLLLLSGERVESLDDPSAAELLAPYGETARDALLRLDGFGNTGDIVLMGRFDPASGEVVSFEELVGSHGGLGGWQTEAFVLHPAGWTVEGPLIGAPSVYQVLRRWRRDLED